MKKILIVLVVLLSFVGIAQADCEIGVAWTPDPTAQSQIVYHNPDGVLDNGDEVLKATVAAGATSYVWTDTGACPASNTVYIVTEYTGGLTMKSAEFTVLSATGAIINNAVKVNQ